jgi:predicted membrane chloride channel (bestrophin family)
MKDIVEVQIQVAMINAISGIIDGITGLQRIRNSPVPLAYTTHLKQILVLYLGSLPFMTIATLQYVPAHTHTLTFCFEDV